MITSSQLLVFDWDGTLMDSVPHIVACLRAAARDVGLPERSEAQLRDVIGLGLQEALAALFPDQPVPLHAQLSQRYREHYFQVELKPAKLFDGIVPLLETLHRRGYYLAIATSKSRSGLDHALKRTGISELFHVTRCADESLSKPHPRMLQEIMQAFSLPPSATIMIGDSAYDLQMAQLAGTHALAVSYGVHDPSRLFAHRPSACFPTVQALSNWMLTNLNQNSILNPVQIGASS